MFRRQNAYIDIDYTNVSDDQFFSDFGAGTSSTSQRFLEQFIEAGYSTSSQYVYAYIRNYQSVDETLPPQFGPYKTLPQVFHGIAGPGYQLGRFGYSYIRSDNQFVSYQRGNSITGSILNLKPSINHRYTKSYLNIESKLEVSHRQYLLDDPNRIFDDNESSTIPTFSVDAKLFAERRTKIFGLAAIQTIEPRLLYLLTPNHDQENLPVFATGLYDTSFQSMFYRDRFGGNGRIGDANQFSIGLTSRIIDESRGTEKLKLNLGQIIHLRDRKVIIPGGNRQTETLSDFLFEMTANPINGIKFRGSARWDPNDDKLRKSTASLRIQPNQDTVLNLGYRQRKGRNIFQPNIKQADISARIPIMDSLALIGRWNYSLEEKESIETFGGIEYESCCWGAKLIARRFLKNSNNADGVHDNSIFMQIHFRGLGGFGRGGSESFITRGIPGYMDPFE